MTGAHDLFTGRNVMPQRPASFHTGALASSPLPTRVRGAGGRCPAAPARPAAGEGCTLAAARLAAGWAPGGGGRYPVATAPLVAARLAGRGRPTPCCCGAAGCGAGGGSAAGWARRLGVAADAQPRRRSWRRSGYCPAMTARLGAGRGRRPHASDGVTGFDAMDGGRRPQSGRDGAAPMAVRLAERLRRPPPSRVGTGGTTWPSLPDDAALTPSLTASAAPLTAPRMAAAIVEGPAAGAAQQRGGVVAATTGGHCHGGVATPRRHSAHAVFPPASAGSPPATACAVTGGALPT